MIANFRKRWPVILVTALVLVLAAAGGVLAADVTGAAPEVAQPGDEVPTFDGFLAALAGPLVAAAVGVILSIVVEYWSGYEALQPKWKRLVFFGLCLIVPIAAAFLRWGLGYVELTFDPLIWHAIWNGAAAGGIGTLAHTRKL